MNAEELIKKAKFFMLMSGRKSLKNLNFTAIQESWEHFPTKVDIKSNNDTQLFTFFYFKKDYNIKKDKYVLRKGIDKHNIIEITVEDFNQYL